MLGLATRASVEAPVRRNEATVPDASDPRLKAEDDGKAGEDGGRRPKDESKATMPRCWG
jgi:hypothetical protein